MLRLKLVLEHIKSLNGMIGMESLKSTILKQLLYILTLEDINNETFPMLHGCIYGPPGVGKTEVAKILANIYSKCGLLNKNTVRIAKREDFVGEFIGSTSLKTKKLLESCLGGVLLIDEVYSFGSEDKRDMFAKEGVDCLNVFLSEHYTEMICIIAGYKEAIDKCFFSINDGLKRRFTNNFTINSYDFNELSSIFLKFLKDKKYNTSFSKNYIVDFFKRNHVYFPYYGGDVKTFVEKCLIYKGTLRMIKSKDTWMILSESDIDEGFKIYMSERVPVTVDNTYKGMFI